MSSYTRSGYVVDLGQEDGAFGSASGSRVSGLVQAIQYTSGPNRSNAETHVITWPQLRDIYEVKFSLVPEDKYLMFDYLHRVLCVGCKYPCDRIDDEGITTQIKIYDVKSQRLGYCIMPDGIGKTVAYSLSFLRETFIP